MKKNKNFESRFWSGRNKHSALALMDVFFQFHDLVTAKERLNRMMQYAVQRKTRIPEDPSVVFHFHQSVRSFIRAGWCVRKKRGKWLVHSLPEQSSPLLQSSLSEEEYRDPAKVFRKKPLKKILRRNSGSSCQKSYISHSASSIIFRSGIS